MRHVLVGKRRNESLLILATTLGITLLAPTSNAASYLIDANYTGASGASGNGYAAQYSDIAAALTAIPAGASASNPNRIYIAPGTYNTASTTGVSLSDSRSNLALIGMTGNPDDVVITSTLDSSYVPSGGSALGTTGSATLQLKGNNVSASAITFGNSTDTPYIATTGKQAVSPQGSYTTGVAQTSNSPAVALLLQGDQQAFSNCKFLGYQDTLYTKGGRTYFTNCTVSGDIDFIFANGTDVFNHSTINMDGDHSGGTITAASTDKRTSNGIVFLNSTITANSVHGNAVIDSLNAAKTTGAAANSMSLGRPWGWQQTGGDASTVFLNTQMSNAIKPAGWLTWNANETLAGNAKNNGDPTEDARYAEFNSMDSSGNPLDVSQRVTWSHQLTAAEAAAYTVDNIFSTESGFAWYGPGYTGSSDPSSLNFSFPAFWGTRNANNDLASDLVPGNPTAYSDPSWTLTSNWDPDAQLAAAIVPAPEPASIALMAAGAVTWLRRRRTRST
jgi:pectinesterase